MKNYTIMIVDGDLIFTNLLTQYLQLEGFKVVCEHDGEIALKRALNQAFDAIILELILPKLSGFELLKEIRGSNKTPILVLTAREDDVDPLVSFELGADDYILKPCDPHKLISRLKTILKRAQKNIVDRPTIEFQGIVIDCAKRTMLLYNEPVELTNTEFNILEILIKAPGQAFSKEELTEYAMGRKFAAFDRSIDVHISNLRTKLGKNSLGEHLIKTKRGFGYLFNVN